MRRLWVCMGEIYGHKWAAAYGEGAATGAGRTWGKGLRGLSNAQLAHGLEVALVSADPWPPTLPQFRSMCLNIPTFAAVKADMKQAEENRSPFTVLVFRQMDSWYFARAEQDKAERMLKDAYEAAREHVMRGGDLPPPQLRLVQEAPPRPAPAPPEVVAMHLQKLAEILGADDDCAGVELLTPDEIAAQP